MQRKVIVLLIVILLFLSACEQAFSAVLQREIYFTFQGSESWEIWKINQDGRSSATIYKIQRELDLSSAQQQELISDDIAEALRSEPFQLDESDLLETQLVDITLSPNKQMLAWLENIYWCPGNYCYGQSAIKVLKLDNHKIIATYPSLDYLGTPSWSLDSKYLIFNKSASSKASGWHAPMVMVFDVSNSESAILSGGNDPFFETVGEPVIADILDKSTPCCQYNLTPTNAFESSLSKLTQFSDFRNPVYSPDGKHAVILAYKENLAYILLSDLDKPNFKEFAEPFEATIRDIEWSPDGELLAVSTIAPFELSVWKVAEEKELFHLERVYEWEWSRDGDEIIFIKRINNGCQQIDTHFYFINASSGKLSKIDFPLSITAYLSQAEFEVICQIGIGSVTW